MIKVAKGSGIPLKIAGEIQPIFRDYFEAEVKPHIDGRFIEYVGEADLEIKNNCWAAGWGCCSRFNGKSRLGGHGRSDGLRNSGIRV